MMSACTMFLKGLLFLLLVLQNCEVVFSASIQCANRFYPIDNTCKMCPAHCKACTNASECSLCLIGYYGQICQNTCNTGCAGTCHKLYGHCTYGCPDGKYADENTPLCLNCPSQCKVCSSFTSCVECHIGYYGNTCEKRCSEHCKAGLCNSTDGTCFECENGFYKISKECVLCPDGCAHCNNSHTCTICKSGFIGTIDGRCLLYCPTINNDEQESICHPGLCQNLPPYWKLPTDECNQAHPSDCVTEGVCVVLIKNRLLVVERTSSDNLDLSLLYMNFKCSFKCPKDATLNFTLDPCKGQICKGMCVLEKPFYSDTYVKASDYTIGDTQPLGTSINSHCTLASAIVGCPIYRYMSNGTCHECPDNCRLCVSDTNCTLCQKGFYGPVCENRCGEGCTGKCHKVFGHCTYGCPDGQYPAERNGCRLCPLRCTLCESQSKCVLCKAGHFGEDCQERCPEHCTACNKTTGQCLQCNDSFFKLNGLCKSCPQGCRSCDSINTCAQCKVSYFKHDRLCKSCPYGCRFCNTTDNCLSCENGFHGPVDGRCLYKCPGNGMITYNVPSKDGRCGIWQDTDTNICHLQSESHSCTLSGNCIQAIGCPYSVQSVDEQYENTSCATVMRYECKHKCKQLLSIYGCEAACTVNAKENVRYNLLCMTDTNFIDLYTFENTTKNDCNQTQVMKQNTPESSLTSSIIAAVVILIVIAIVIIMWVFRRKWYCPFLQTITNWKGLTVKKKFPKEEPESETLSDDAVTQKDVVNVNVSEPSAVINNEMTTEEAEVTPFIDEGIGSSSSSKSSTLEEVLSDAQR